MARCPAHGDRAPSLSVSIGNAAVLLHDFGGCSKENIVAAIGLTMADLFPKTNDAWRRQQDGLRRQMRATPVETATTLLRRELERVREAERERLGYDPPVTSRTVNAVRARVGRICGVELAPIPAFVWECPPHDGDPLWPMLFERALEQMAWEADGPTPCDALRAKELAAEMLHELTESTK